MAQGAEVKSRRVVSLTCCFLCCLLGWLAFTGFGADSADAQAPRPGSELAGKDELVIRPEELSGDAAEGRRAAHRLLQAISGEGRSAEAHLRYLQSALAKTRLVAPDADFVGAQRIVEEINAWISRAGLPFPEVGRVLRPLLGVGPAEFREAVVQAYAALLNHQKELRRGGTDLQQLKDHVLNSPPLSPPALRDGFKVLWTIDRKGTLQILIQGLTLLSPPDAGSMATSQVCLAELRARLPVDFGTPAAWQQWWTKVRGLSFEEILLECSRGANSRLVENWRSLVGRLRETQDADRLLAALQDTLTTSTVAELRIAAVAALGDFGEWLRDINVKGLGGINGQAEEARQRFRRAAVQTLLSVLGRKEFPLEQVAVIQECLQALSQYQEFLERDQALRDRAAEAVVLELSTADSLGDTPAARGIRLAAIRLSGALRVGQTMEYVHGVVERQLGTNAAPDLELLTSAVQALGRLIEEKGASRSEVQLLIRHFSHPHAAPEKLVRELRRACVTALSNGSREPDVQEEVLRFYREVLFERQEASARVHVIIGLGSLAQARVPTALDTLFEVLEKQEQYGPSEIQAVIDSIAYVGGDKALEGFLRHLPANNKDVQTQIMAKVLGFVEDGGLPDLSVALGRLAQLALEQDSPIFLALADQLAADERVRTLFDGRQADLTEADEIRAWAQTTLILARLHDLLGKEEEATRRLASLRMVVDKTPELKTVGESFVTELERFEKALARRKVINERLSSPEVGTTVGTLKDLEAVVAAESSALGAFCEVNWVARRLAMLADSTETEELLQGWLATLRAETGPGVWPSLPERFRRGYLERLANPKPESEKKTAVEPRLEQP